MRFNLSKTVKNITKPRPLPLPKGTTQKAERIKRLKKNKTALLPKGSCPKG